MEIGLDKRVAPGEKVCGDDCVVLNSGNITTIAVADGVGHGPHAAEASAQFCAYVSENQGRSLPELLHGAHAALAKTRGVVAAIIRINEDSAKLEFAGVGNIELHAHAHESIKPFSGRGLIGRRLTKFPMFSYQLTKGDLLVAFSDGVSSRTTDLRKYQGLGAQSIAEAIIDDNRRELDDAICVAVWY